MDGATPVGIRLRRSIPEHDAYTVYLADHRFAVLATARPSDARRWVATTRWLHPLLLYHGRLVVGLGVQWTPTFRPLGSEPPLPATLQLCVGHRCLVFHLAQADAVPQALRRFLADPRVTFVGSGSAYDRRILWDHFGLHVACGRELRDMAGMGNASMEVMAHRFLGYPGVSKSREVAMSAWHAPRLSMYQVQYAAVDAFLAFRLGLHLCPAADGVFSANIDEEDDGDYASEYSDDGEEILGQDDWYEQEYGCDMDEDEEEVLGAGQDDWYEQDYGCDMDEDEEGDEEEVLGQNDWCDRSGMSLWYGLRGGGGGAWTVGHDYWYQWA